MLILISMLLPQNCSYFAIFCFVNKSLRVFEYSMTVAKLFLSALFVMEAACRPTGLAKRLLIHLNDTVDNRLIGLIGLRKYGCGIWSEVLVRIHVISEYELLVFLVMKHSKQT